ncbi:hypothetical protein EPUS_03455 [Endocarpon pusillum Z07020]|uniref:Serine/threonine-protein kinase chk2 n=1 Tax=Endocarpon pusillum (strain Z07020 / HMAS-L-300199) TaxID=1263415 RepID=U1GHL7_ENDPU|nr:uncharacterized protein EPUS_03455 [Endocarpon pusillum Z07020]ERF71301.1 hypothetical protein EPUS_03455 [Endocarpon pusillum Z07020]
MAPQNEKSSLKRGRASTRDEQDVKKPRRSTRISSQSHPKSPSTPVINKGYLPSPLTNQASTATETYKDGTVTPPEGRPSQIRHHTPASSPRLNALSSPPGDTQPLSQFVFPPRDLGDSDEEPDESTWGYLHPLDERWGKKLIMKKRPACPAPAAPLEKARLKHKKQDRPTGNLAKDEERYEKTKREVGFPAGGYLIGRHPECDVLVDIPTISNRHCLLFSEHKHGETIAVLEDLSSNGTFVNEAIVGRNKRRELEDGDEITIVDEARFVFRYPRRQRESSAFRSQFRMLQQLGKGHFASVYLCIEKATGFKYAVKKFERRMGDSQRSQTEGLQQEIAVLMSVSHPNVLCLKETFDEADGVYLVLELAPEGELFNWIVMKQKLSEEETRKVFIQLFQGIKYLHERNIVHRDIKPENILLTDKNLSVKLADFGLAKIIGEQSFTTTLCGTPSYVAPEILAQTRQRKYTRAVDVWSLGVVLYICLCGFPPFSDELYSAENPYSLAQQIKMGRFDYPSPYWDSVGDPALDLIDRMLTVDADLRITVDECLNHPWITGKLDNWQLNVSLSDSTDGLTGQLNQLDFSKRKMERQRTLLSAINDVKIMKKIREDDPNSSAPPTEIKVFDKNPDGKKRLAQDLAGQKKVPAKENDPAAERATEEFMGMGGKGDMALFDDDVSSRYLPQEVPQ